MRSRIIFRGLTLFTFSKKDAKDAKAGDNLGTMTAWLVNDPGHSKMPDHTGMALHTHTPRFAAVGRDLNQPNGQGYAGTKQDMKSDMKIEHIGNKAEAGVVVDGSFLRYIPCIGKLYGPTDYIPKENSSYIQRRVEIPSGRIRSGEFIWWDWQGKTPARVAYMGTHFGGFAANEVVIDVGDDDDINTDDPKSYLSITHDNKEDKVWPRAKGRTLVDGIEPNVVEVVITNLTARRRRPVFWGLHFQTFFEALGYSSRDYTATQQYVSFLEAARNYDAYEWGNDAMMKAVHPFPFLIDPRGDILGLIAEAPEPYVVQGAPPTPPSARQSGEGMDPDNTEICPPASK